MTDPPPPDDERDGIDGDGRNGAVGARAVSLLLRVARSVGTSRCTSSYASARPNEAALTRARNAARTNADGSSARITSSGELLDVRERNLDSLGSLDQHIGDGERVCM